MKKKLFVSLLAFVLALTLCGSALAATVLRPGSKGDAVKEVQKLLRAYGYYTGAVDGKYSTGTENAVKAFQYGNDLTVDGKVGPKTNAVLTSGGAVPASEAKKLPTAAEQKAAEAEKAEAIKSAQTLLKQYGYYAGKLTGKLDDATVAAVKAFQNYNDLEKTGKLDTATLEKLNGQDVVKAPISSKETANKDDVKHVQERLAYYGFYTLKVDGLYGAGSIAAVKNFQKANGLKADGIVGPDTLKLLDADDSVSKKTAGEKDTLSRHPILRKNDSNNYVKEAQQLLKAAGYYTGKLTGKMDEATVKAIRAYQKANELTVDGKVGPKTWAKLLEIDISIVEPEKEEETEKVRTVLRYGDKGDDVKALQEKLTQLGYKVKADGSYGEKTTKAVLKFQKDNGLTEDGKAGPFTLAAIEAKLSAE